MIPNTAFIRTILNIQRNLNSNAECLHDFANRRGFGLSESLEKALEEHAANLATESEELAYFLNQYLDSFEAKKGGE